MQRLMSSKTKLGNVIELFGEPSVENVLVIGVMHGDEPQGKFLIEEYLKKISKDFGMMDKKGKLFLPCLNPDGVSLKTRTNANGVDLNRNFPTKNWGEDTSSAGDNPADYFGGVSPASELETQFLIKIIEKYQPKTILTLHAPYKVVNYDGPAISIAQKISEIIGYPTEGSIGYPTPGSFGTWAGVERQIPTITLELDEICPVENLIEPVFRIFELL